MRKDFISPELTKVLLTMTVAYIEEMKVAIRAHDQGQVEGNDWVEPNDYTIWENILKPQLEAHLRTGFYPEQILSKGFGFLMSIIAGRLIGLQKRHKLSKEMAGALLKLYVEHELQSILDYSRCIEADYYLENQEHISERVSRLSNHLTASRLLKDTK